MAQTAYSISAQAQQAKAQNKAISNQLDVVNEEARQKATADIFDASRAARREQGRLRAAAGEAGMALSSGSVEALLFDSAMQAELEHDRSLANLESRTKANAADATSMYSSVRNTNGLAAGLQLGASALSGWSGIEAAKIEQRRAERAAQG
ncbi:hypothetical protein [Croceicoccus sp. Ery15]|uniref:virion core protein, T7 gp14 family n=1 Tax=Croceicoccus sp. Ery15 TaxID=1703338 RepID=UPI001E449679|nr:hypothetical protein [Croceicoccus sp. Ery15]